MIAENENLEPAEPVVIPLVDRKEIGRNDPCPCNSGKKYKKCHESSGKMLLPDEMRHLMQILVSHAKGITVPQTTFDEPSNFEGMEVNILFDAEKQAWKIWPQKPRPEPKLILHKKRIILPN